MKTTKETDYTGHKDYVQKQFNSGAEKQRIQESRSKLVSSSVVLGSDPNDMRSEYATNMRMVTYK